MLKLKRLLKCIIIITKSDKKKLIKIGNDFKENYFTKPTKVNVNPVFKFKYMNVVILMWRLWN